MNQGHNEDMPCLDPHFVYAKERSIVEKKEGGKLMSVRNGVNHILWEPVLVMFPYLDAERSWILTHENSTKIAFVVCIWQQRSRMGSSECGTMNSIP